MLTTVRLRLVGWLVPPEVPVIVTVEVPAPADEEAESVNVEGALPPEGGVTLEGMKFAVTPAGNPDALKLVGLLNPFMLVTVTVALALFP